MVEAHLQTPEHPNEYWSLNRASKELGINKSTLSTDAKNGKIQWHDQTDGSRKFFAPALYSFYAVRLQNRTERTERVLNVVTSTENERPEQSKNSDLNSTLEAKAELIDALKSQITDLKHDRDKWQEQATKATQQLTEALTVIKMLPAPTTQAPARSEDVAPPPRKKFLGLF